MKHRVDALRNEAGFTIIEVMVAAMLLVIGLIGTLALADTSNRLSVQNKNRVGATNIARQVIEDIKSLDYDRVDATNITGDLAGAGLTDQDATATGIQQVRGAVTYTIQVVRTASGNTVSPCVLDSNTDGSRAATDTAYYCVGSVTAGGTPADGNPDDFRRVEVTVTWPGPQGAASCSGVSGGNGRNCVTESVLLQNPSGGIGPSIQSITLQSTGLIVNGDGVIEQGTAATFAVVTRASADEVHWTADDGVSAGTATGGNRNWTFTWAFPPSLNDGAHTITVQAFLLGSGGSARPTVVNINVNLPATPNWSVAPLLKGGVDTRVTPIVDFTWKQNPETDIRGYKVYRAVSGAPVLSGSNVDPVACSTTDVTVVTCFDPLPASAITTALCNPSLSIPCLINYYVVAFDSRWTSRAEFPARTCTSPVNASIDLANFAAPERPSCPTATFAVDVNGGQQEVAPGPPTNLTKSTVNGLPVLNWDAATPDGTDTIAFYRIYRDGVPVTSPQYSQRIGRTQDAATLTFTDTSAPTGTHTYSVTAVDSHYQESVNPPPTVTWP